MQGGAGGLEQGFERDLGGIRRRRAVALLAVGVDGAGQGLLQGLQALDASRAGLLIADGTSHQRVEIGQVDEGIDVGLGPLGAQGRGEPQHVGGLLEHAVPGAPLAVAQHAIGSLDGPGGGSPGILEALPRGGGQTQRSDPLGGRCDGLEQPGLRLRESGLVEEVGDLGEGRPALEGEEEQERGHGCRMPDGARHSQVPSHDPPPTQGRTSRQGLGCSLSGSARTAPLATLLPCLGCASSLRPSWRSP